MNPTAPRSALDATPRDCIAPRLQPHMDLTAVYAAADKAQAAEEGDRLVRSADLWGRAATAAQELRQTDCLVVAYLRCLQCHALMQAALMELCSTEVEKVHAQVFIEQGLSHLPAIFATVERRMAAGTLGPGTCREYELRFFEHNCLRNLAPDLIGTTEGLTVAKKHAEFLGQDVVLYAGCFSMYCLKLMVSIPCYETLFTPDAPERCAFVVRALDTALEHGMRGRWISLHTWLLDMAEDELHTFTLVGQLFAEEGQALLSATRRLSDHATREHSMKTQNDHDTMRELEESLAVAARSESRRTCALPGCSARELHVKHFKACAACRIPVYCSKEHQTADWPAHKAACKAARKADAAQQQQQPQPQKQ